MVLETGVDLRKQLGLGEGKDSLEFREELRPKPFVQTWAEWAADGNREQILRSAAFCGQSSTELFEVPIGNSLMITSAFIHSHQITPISPTGQQTLFIDIGNGQGELIGTVNDLGSSRDFSDGMSITFHMPIKVDETRKIILQNASGDGCLTGGFHGWLEPKKV